MAFIKFFVMLNARIHLQSFQPLVCLLSSPVSENRDFAPHAGLSRWEADSTPTHQLFFFRLHISSTFHFSSYQLCLCSYVFAALKWTYSSLLAVSRQAPELRGRKLHYPLPQEEVSCLGLLQHTLPGVGWPLCKYRCQDGGRMGGPKWGK